MAEPLIERIIRRQAWMEGVGGGLQNGIGAFYRVLGRPGQALKNLMHGTWLGHPLHPAITDVPMGAWLVGVVADYAALISSRVPTEVGNLALGVGILGAVLAAATGYTDFHETFGQERRYALAHGLLMTMALVFDVVSIALRTWAGGGAHGLAVGLATAGFLVAAGSAWLGGHLVFGLGTMVNRSAFLEGGPEDFVPVGSSEDFAEGRMRAVDAGGMSVLMLRRRGRLCAISDVCSHAGGPLHEGEFDGAVVTCPWHQSRFRVSDGRVVGGPATFDQPALTVREQSGSVEVKLEHPLH
ncbi:MAG: Rieske 2Fe-2S domain-containing protein [Candidatus Dormibacteria bacterium]